MNLPAHPGEEFQDKEAEDALCDAEQFHVDKDDAHQMDQPSVEK